jgi:hypothetical protein
MMQVLSIIRRIFPPVAPEDTKPKYIPGEPIAGSKHYLLEEEQQRDREWLQKCGAYERLRGSGMW